MVRPVTGSLLLVVAASLALTACPSTATCPTGRQRYKEACVRDDVVDFIKCVHENQGDSIEIDHGKTLGGTVQALGATVSSTNELRNKTIEKFTAQTPANAEKLMNKCYALAGGQTPPSTTATSASPGVEVGTAPSGSSGAVAAAATCPMECSAQRLRLTKGKTYQFVLKDKRTSGADRFDVFRDATNASTMNVMNSSSGTSFTVPGGDNLYICTRLTGTGGGCETKCSSDVAAGKARLFTDQLYADFAVTCE